jgi:ribosomal protein S28E/S33
MSAASPRTTAAMIDPRTTGRVFQVNCRSQSGADHARSLRRSISGLMTTRSDAPLHLLATGWSAAYRSSISS